MFYEEKLIDGVLHFRGTPDGEWQPMTLAMYERKRIGYQQRIEQLEAALREAILEHEDQADNWAYIGDDQNAKYHRERAATLRKALQ